MHDRGKNEPVQLVCPRCRQLMIVYLPIEEMPRCPNPELPGDADDHRGTARRGQVAL